MATSKFVDILALTLGATVALSVLVVSVLAIYLLFTTPQLVG